MILYYCVTDRQTYRQTDGSYYNRVSQRIQNETEEETEARREDARQRVSQRVQNEAEGETKPIIFYLYLIKFQTNNSPSHTLHNLPSFLTARVHQYKDKADDKSNPLL